MSLPLVSTDLHTSQERQHRTQIANALNECIRVRPPHDVTEEEITAGITPIDTTYPPGDVRRYGAVLDGTTDDTDAFQNAGLASLSPYAPNLPTVITGSIPFRDNQVWTNYARIAITGTTLEVFTADAGIDDWAIVGNWTVTGDNGAAGATSGSAAAVRVTDSMRWKIDGLTAKNIKGWGIRLRPGSSTSTRSERGQITRYQAYACYRGIETEAGTGAEYAIVEAPIIARCNVGMRLAAGNTSVVGGSVSDNTTGFDLVNGTNHGHGVISGVEINHNTTQIKANTVTFGQRFSGCAIHQGIIHFDHSTGVIVSDGLLDVDAYRFEESDGCGFLNNTMPMGYANAISNNYNTTNSYTVWAGNKTNLGEPWNGGLGNIKGVRVSATQGSNQVISAANVNATATIILDTKATASANQATQSVTAYLASYSTSTGVFTCVKGGDGKVRVAAQFVITVNAADADNFQVFMTHSTLGDYYCALIPLGAHASATSWIATLDIELPIDLTQTLTFKITGSGVANNVTISNSGGTKAQVEGL
jgi:hypothetical protein